MVLHLFQCPPSPKTTERKIPLHAGVGLRTLAKNGADFRAGHFERQCFTCTCAGRPGGGPYHGGGGARNPESGLIYTSSDRTYYVSINQYMGVTPSTSGDIRLSQGRSRLMDNHQSWEFSSLYALYETVTWGFPVDGVTPIYWFITAPRPKPTNLGVVGLAIYFHADICLHAGYKYINSTSPYLRIPTKLACKI